jgi:hypothetical protein
MIIDPMTAMMAPTANQMGQFMLTSRGQAELFAEVEMHLGISVHQGRYRHYLGRQPLDFLALPVDTLLQRAILGSKCFNLGHLML